MVLEKGRPLRCTFAEGFVQTDQDVADLEVPKPETFYCLLEMPKEEVETLEKGMKFRFQEQSTAGKMALCSDTKTYEMEFLENSNSLLIGSIGEASAAGEESTRECTVIAQCRGQLILKPTIMDAARARGLLTQPLGGSAALDAMLPKVTTETLGYEVAASPAELQTLLDGGPYVEHGGAWRLLPVALESSIIDASLDIVTARGWDTSALDGTALLREVQQHLGEDGEASVPSIEVLRKALRSFASGLCEATPAAPDGGGAEGGAPDAAGASPGSRLVFDKEKVKKAKARRLLRMNPQQVRDRFQLPPPAPRPKRARTGASGAASIGGLALQLEEFGAAFRELADVEVSAAKAFAFVTDCAYIDEFAQTVHSINSAALPQDPRERLARLFEIQSHWNPERLAVLMEPSLPTGVKAWLAKWARVVFVEIEQGKEERLMVKKFSGL